VDDSPARPVERRIQAVVQQAHRQLVRPRELALEPVPDGDVPRGEDQVAIGLDAREDGGGGLLRRHGVLPELPPVRAPPGLAVLS